MHSKNATIALSNLRCMNVRPKGMSPLEYSSSIERFGARVEARGSVRDVDGDVRTSCLMMREVEPMGCNSYPSNLNPSLSATVDNKSTVCPHAALISGQSTGTFDNRPKRSPLIVP